MKAVCRNQHGHWARRRCVICSLHSLTAIFHRYGYEVSGKNDRYIATANEAVGLLSAAFLPGAYLVDIIPVCLSLPTGSDNAHCT
jgi:hypothetical protein